MKRDEHERLRAGVDDRSFELHWQAAGRDALEPGGESDRAERERDWLCCDEQRCDGASSSGGLPPTRAPWSAGRAWIGASVAAGARLAVLLVPIELANAITRNGAPLAAGLHLVAHADRLELGAQRVWVSFDRAPREEPYEPERHGADLRCARTKARLALGEAVVRCPGRADGAPCQLVYRAAVWSAAPRCHACGREAAQPAWTPPTPRPERDRHDHLQRALDAAQQARA